MKKTIFFAVALPCILLGPAATAVAQQKATLQTTPPGGFRTGFQYELSIRCPTNRSDRFTFTSGAEFAYTTKRADGSVATNRTVRRVDVEPAERPGSFYFWSWHGAGRATRTAWYLNPVLPEQTFSTMDDDGRAQERDAAIRARNPLREKLRLGVRVEDDAYLLFVNGVYVVSLPREEGDTPGFNFPPSYQPDPAVAIRQADSRWELVDISERTNAGGFGRRLAPGGTVTNVAGVPFVIPPSPSDAIDLFQSRFAGGLRLTNPIASCRNRWPDPLLRTPLRYSFRAPGGEYDALYVLCAADGNRRDAIPRFTAQFYRHTDESHGSGRPFNFPSGPVPASTNGSLHVVRVPLSGDLRTELGPEPVCFFELTKDVQPFQSYPDPEYYSMHGAGLPSSVRVLGVTLHRPEVAVSFDPCEPANAFVEGQKIAYEATLENTTGERRDETLIFTAASWDGGQKVRQEKSVALQPGERKAVGFSFAPSRYGWFAVSLSAAGREFHHSAAYLKARDYTRRPFEHKGLRFGTWQMFLSEATASFLGKAGFDTAEFRDWPPRVLSAPMQEIWDRYGFMDFQAPGRSSAPSAAIHGDNFETNVLRVIGAWAGVRAEDPGSGQWKYTRTIDEPGGIGTGNAQFPEYYGEPTNAFDYARISGKERERYEIYKTRMRAGAEALRRILPDAKHLMPNGSWTFLIPYLQDPETRFLADGVKCDFQFYNHIPEEQIYETSPHSLYFFRQAWGKYRPDTEPLLIIGEGPDILQVYPGASTQEEDASLRLRDSIILAGYGVGRQLDCAMYPFSYPEFHCAGGLAVGKFARDPTWGYCAMATWTRLTRDATFESFSPVGSTSAYCANFRNHKTGKLLRAIWTVRGKRDFVFPCRPGDLTVLDPMDNEVKAPARDGGAVVTVGQMPYFILGADDAPPAVSPDPDHSDDALAPTALPLGSLAEHFGTQTDDADDPYVNSFTDHIKRFHATMDIVATNDAARGPVLSVGLPKQAVDRMVMPYFTCLTLKKPVPIPGKAAALRLDVRAASDWGRVVFVLKDASGRRYYSSGQKGEWNADDMGCHSFFCFDGWRRLKIALPSNAPWDAYRESGFATWGSDDPKAPVALPLAIEKLFVERRGGVMYGNGYVPFDHDTPVLLGALHAEYASEADTGEEAIRLSRLRVPPVPVSQQPNPIAEMAKANPLPAGRIVSVKDPDTWFNGTNGDFSFELPEEAVSWEVWAAMDRDGRGALRLGKDLRKNPCNVRGFLAGKTFHAFVVWRDKAGRQSKPSEPFEVRLEDHFAHQ